LSTCKVESGKLIGSRGVGEGGMVLAPAALLNATEDALGQVGEARITAAPVTPARSLEAQGVPDAGTGNQ
jgi:aerobic carbon-monoxide dehydrogenase large subunit